MKQKHCSALRLMLTHITGRTRLPEVMAQYIICVAGLCSYWGDIGFTLWIRPMGEGTSIILIEEIERVTHRLICYFRKIRGSNAYSVVLRYRQ